MNNVKVPKKLITFSIYYENDIQSLVLVFHINLMLSFSMPCTTQHIDLQDKCHSFTCQSVHSHSGEISESIACKDVMVHVTALNNNQQ